MKCIYMVWYNYQTTLLKLLHRLSESLCRKKRGFLRLHFLNSSTFFIKTIDKWGKMCGGHAAYQERVLAQLRKYYPDAPDSLSPSTWEIMEKFWNLDLSEVDSFMQDRYSVFGPAPRLPSDMLRSILISVEFGIAGSP